MTENSPWRLILHPPYRGAKNMAVDEAILEAVSSGEAPPTLRLYRWEPACLSLGYGQRYREVDEGGLAANGWDVVRRPTGGKAILHVDELTYSIAAPLDHPLMRGGVLPSYRRIAAGLLNGLDKLSVNAETRERYQPGTPDPGPVCFETPSDWEITWEGRKLIGSAQVRRKNGVLQHGTLPLHGDLARITMALAFDTEVDREAAAARVRRKAATIEDVVSRRVSWEAAARAIADGFERQLGTRLAEMPLSMAEDQSARRLEIEKYGLAAWTQRRA